MKKQSPSSPQKMEMNMPGMQMPSASPNPQTSPQQKMEMSMPMPSPSPGASPQKMDMNMPMPGASPSATPMGQMPGMDMSGPNMNMGTLTASDSHAHTFAGSDEFQLSFSDREHVALAARVVVTGWSARLCAGPREFAQLDS
jgi:hypothetical protein